MLTEERNALFRCLPDLIKSLEANDIADQLVSKECISHSRYIRCIESRESNADRVRELIRDVLKNEKPNAFGLFVEALKSSWDFLAERLESTVEAIQRDMTSTVAHGGDVPFDNTTEVKTLDLEYESLSMTSRFEHQVVQQEEGACAGGMDPPNLTSCKSPMIKQRSLDNSFSYDLPQIHEALCPEDQYADANSQCRYTNRMGFRFVDHEHGALHSMPTVMMQHPTGQYRHGQHNSHSDQHRPGLHQRRLGQSQPDLTQALHLQIPGHPLLEGIAACSMATLHPPPSLGCIRIPTPSVGMATPPVFNSQSPRWVFEDPAARSPCHCSQHGGSNPGYSSSGIHHSHSDTSFHESVTTEMVSASDIELVLPDQDIPRPSLTTSQRTEENSHFDSAELGIESLSLREGDGAEGRELRTSRYGDFYAILKREKQQPFGFKLKECWEGDSRMFQVFGIDRNGVAARTGDLLEGDYITAINGTPSSEMMIVDAHFAIRDVEDFLILRLRRYGYFRQIEKTVRLHRDFSGIEFGFRLRWGGEEARFPGDRCYYVHYVLPGSPASKFLQVGDVIRAIDRVNVDRFTHAELKNKIRPFRNLDVVIELERTEFQFPLL